MAEGSVTIAPKNGARTVPVDHGSILVAMTKPDTSRFAEATLRLEGYDVVLVGSGTEALERSLELMPDVIMLDLDLRNPDGVEICRRLRADAAAEHILIVVLASTLLTARRVEALDAGADDFIESPFDQVDLLARVRAVLRRSRLLRDASPLTGMPGNSRIRKELSIRIERDVPFAMLHVDLDHFKAFNDRYGLSRGDDALRLTGGIVRTCARTYGGLENFAGHLGGDDFVVIVSPEQSEAVAEAIIAEWDERAPGLYDEVDAERGYVEIADRRRILRRYPLAGVSIGIATTDRRRFESPVEVSEVASAMKMVAKKEIGSTYAIDRRSEGHETAV